MLGKVKGIFVGGVKAFAKAVSFFLYILLSALKLFLLLFNIVFKVFLAFVRIGAPR